MDQIRISATPNNVVMNPEPTRVVLRLNTGPQGPAGPPAEIYIQQTQPATPQNVGAIWYQTDANGQIQSEHVWDGSQWRLTPTGSGIANIVPLAPITASGQSIVTVGVDVATDSTAGVVERLAKTDDVTNVTAGPVVDSALLAMMLAATVPNNTSDLTNDGDGIGGPYVDANGASLAAPIQSLIAGNDIHISNVGKDFIIAAVPNPEHQSDWLVSDTNNPAYIKNKPTNVSSFANDAGYITISDAIAAAPVQSVNGMTGAVVIDLSPYATNADLALTNAKFADYLPLAGGSISGALSVAGAFNVGPAGTARVPTVALTDASTSAATTEWVQSLMAATGAIKYMWKYGGFNVSADPGLGNLNIATGNTTIAISKTDGHGNQRYLDPIATGDTIVLTDNPASGPATEYQRFDVIGTPTDNGGWLSVPVSLAGGTLPTRIIGEEMRVTIGLDSQVATIEGVSAGYGLTGGGVSGVVTLAADLAVMAEKTDLPTKTSELTNDGSTTSGPFVDVAEAATAAPIQSLIAGTDISIVNVGKDFTISALRTPEHQSDWNVSDVGSPAYIKNKPTNVSAFANDAGYITAAQVPPDAVQSVNAKTGVVVLTATDVGALPDTTTIPTKTSELTNDGEGSGPFITAAQVPPSAQADWNVSDTQSPAYILNKPTVVSAFTNDAGYVTQTDIDSTVADYLPLAGGTMTGAIVTTDGTAAAPAVKFDDATGTFQPAANTWAVSTAGTERFRVRPGGTLALSQSNTVPTTGSNSHGISQRFDLPNNGMLQYDVGYAQAGTDNAYGIWAQINSNAPDGTAHNGVFNTFQTGQSTAGANTTIADHRGYSASDQTVPDTASGFFTSMSLRAGKTRYGIFCDGSAPNRFDGQVQVPVGNPTTPSISLVGDDTGISFATDTIMLSTAGVERLRVTAQGSIQTGLGTSAAPSISYNSDTDTGTFSPAANTWAVSVGGVERLRVRSDGNVSVGSSGTTYDRFAVGGECANNSSPRGITVDHVLTAAADGAGSSFMSAPTVSVSTWGYYHYNISDVTGAGVLTSSQTGLQVSDLQKAPTNRGVRLRINSGGGKTNHNIYADGTAPNYFAGQIQASLGTAAAPSISYLSDPDTGTFSPAANTWAVSTGGVERLRVGATGDVVVASGGRINFDTTASMRTSAGSFLISHDGASQMLFRVGGQDDLILDPANHRVRAKIGFVTEVGSAAAPAYSFFGADTEGMFRVAGGSLGFSTAGTERLRVKSTGGVKYVPLATAPTTPEEGEVYFDSTTKKLRVYNGTAWADLH